MNKKDRQLFNQVIKNTDPTDQKQKEYIENYFDDVKKQFTTKEK